MRGIASLSVVTGHLITSRFEMGIPQDRANAIAGFLRSGVDVFFVISGFIIALSADQTGKTHGRAGLSSFVVKRCVRIFPVYWMVLIATILSITMFPGALKYLPHEVIFDSDLSRQALLITRATTYMPQAWSMAFEVTFYATVAAFLLVAPTRVMEGIFLAVIALAVIDLSPAPKTGWLISDPLIIDFGLGAGVGYLAGRGITLFWPLCAACSIALFAYAAFHTSASIWGVFGMERVATFGLGSALAVYAVSAAELRGLTFPKSLQYLGAMSYSLYVWHMLILMWLANLLLPSIPGPIQLAAWLVIVLAISAASYEFIERPLLRRVRESDRAILPERLASAPVP